MVLHRIAPVMVTRDFNLNPHRLRLWGRLPMDQLTFPDLQRRVTLSGPNQPHGPAILAVLCREGIAPFSQALIGAKRIRRAAAFSSFFVNFSACVGWCSPPPSPVPGPWAPCAPGTCPCSCCCGWSPSC